MPLKAILGDLEWNIFIVTQPWWATFKIGIVVIFTGKTHKSFLKSQIEFCPIQTFSHLTADVNTIVDILVLSQTRPAKVGWPSNDLDVSNDLITNLSFCFCSRNISFWSWENLSSGLVIFLSMYLELLRL